MKIRNYIATTIAVTSTALLVGFSVITLNTLTAKADQATLVNLVIEESQTVSAFEYETIKLAEMLYGEAKGEPDDWPHLASGTFNRVGDERWDDNVIGVLLTVRPNGRGCEIDAMCDELMENLTTLRGQEALRYAEKALSEYYQDAFVFTHECHSWVTPEALKTSAYHQGLMPVLQSSAHIHLCDKPLRPRARPECLMGCAPKTSTRPIARPMVRQDPVLLALLEAN